MKCITLLIFSFIVSVYSATAQDWSCIKVQDTTYYTVADSPANNYLRVIWVDSAIAVAGTDRHTNYK